MLELRIIAGGTPLPLFDLPAALGRKKAAREIGDTIESLIAFMDDIDGDPDLEDGGDDEPDGTGEDISWPEWHTRGSRKLSGDAEMRTRGLSGFQLTDDDEDDDPAEDDDDDHMIAGPVSQVEWWPAHREIGDDADAEPLCTPSYHFDQTMDVMERAANDVEAAA